MLAGIVASQPLSSPPSNTYATLDPTNKHADIALSNGNLTATKGGSALNRSVRSTLGVSSGKHYFEVRVVEGSVSPFMILGVGVNDAATLPTAVGVSATSWGYYEDTGQKHNNNTLSTYGNTWKTNGDVIGIALDMDSGKVWFSKNGVWQNSGDPAAGTNPAFTGLTGTIYAYLSLYRPSPSAHVLTANFGASALTYSPPIGFRSGLYT